jgi:hypothetical protein
VGAAQESNATRPATKPAEQPLPHIEVDREAREVRFEAKVNLREARWLELIATTPQGRTHEALLVTEARPSHIHLALLLIGLEPGRPMRIEREGESTAMRPPEGPALRISLLPDDAKRAVRVGRWIRHAEEDRALPEGGFLFAGSGFRRRNGERGYQADRSGNVISLVQFGDELIARDTRRTRSTDEGRWQCWTERIPPAETPVTVRLRPGPAREGGPHQPGDSG